MAWVRYDDQFPYNPKVTAVIAEDPGAIGLHVLANTWTNGQKRKGHIPAHQPGILVCDKARGQSWATLLVRHGLWHPIDDLCPDCKDEYADLPPDLDGFVFHNASEYRAPGRDRVTSGTSQELSEKRRAAGRKGGQASARKRDEAKQKQAKQASAQANQANEQQHQAEDEPDPQQPPETGNEDVPPLTLVTSEELPSTPKPPKPRKTRRKPDRTPLDDEADSLTNGYWDRYSKTTAQKWISVRQITLGALHNAPDERNNIARALDALGQENRPITQASLTYALKQVREQRGQRPTGTDGPFSPLDNVNDLWKDRQ